MRSGVGGQGAYDHVGQQSPHPSHGCSAGDFDAQVQQRAEVHLARLQGFD